MWYSIWFILRRPELQNQLVHVTITVQNVIVIIWRTINRNKIAQVMRANSQLHCVFVICIYSHINSIFVSWLYIINITVSLTCSYSDIHSGAWHLTVLVCLDQSIRALGFPSPLYSKRLWKRQMWAHQGLPK
jgi:hypothetical protein